MKSSEQTNELFTALAKAQSEMNSHEEGRLVREIFGRLKCSPAKPKSHLAAIISKVKFGLSDCWHWCARLTIDGYGATEMLGEHLAHRVSWRVFRGDIPEGMNVLHSCDVRSCINPDHLFLGTQAENVTDMQVKNRQHRPIGEKNPKAKLTRNEASAIRQRHGIGASRKRLAEDFGVSLSTINRIIHNESWSVQDV